MATHDPVTPEKFPFDSGFQKTLIRLLCEDDDLAHTFGKFLQPQHFESEVLAWAYAYIQRHREDYGTSPSVGVLVNQTKYLDAKIRPIYEMAVNDIKTADLRDEMWLRAKVLDFVRRNIFVQTFNESKGLYNTGKVTEAYDMMMDRMEELMRVTWEPVDESNFFDDLARRQAKRMQEQAEAGAIATGFPFLDKVLGGGLSPGELGIWIAYPKYGKSTMLMTLGKSAVSLGMRPTMHFVLEGSRSMVENRYDSAFMQELYSSVKSGDVDDKKYHAAYKQYQVLKGKLIIRGFTERFDYSILDIQEALKDAHRRYNFKPHMIIVDYGDLLGGRDMRKGYKSETEKQKAAFRDLKILTSRGYAMWTASQAQRPKEGYEVKAELLKSRSIADCYEKVRVADFLGSLNQTLEERGANLMRLYAELYRENEADKWQVIRADYAHMMMRQEPGLTSTSIQKATGETGETASLGYGAATPPKQTMAPI